MPSCLLPDDGPDRYGESIRPQTLSDISFVRQLCLAIYDPEPILGKCDNPLIAVIVFHVDGLSRIGRLTPLPPRHKVTNLDDWTLQCV